MSGTDVAQKHGTAIEWTQAPGFKGETWNPVTGCDRVSPGCAHCYALDLAARLKAMGQARYQRDGDPKTSGPGFAVTLHPDKLDEPLRWRKPRMVFVNSMSDLFHEEIPDEYIARVFTTMFNARQHIFQVLTKRPERMRTFVRRLAWEPDPARREWENLWRAYLLPDDHWTDLDEPARPVPNVWLGVSIENRRFVGRADLLRDTPAAVRFISAEPLLGPLVYDNGGWETIDGVEWGWCGDGWADGRGGRQLDLTDIDWLIVGGESGPDHRPVDPQWVRDLRDECLRIQADFDPTDVCMTGAEGPAFFFKQWGGRTPKAGGRELDGRTWDEFPAVRS